MGKNYSPLLPALICCLGFSAALSLNAAAVEPMDPTSPMSPALAAQLSQGVNRSVIVIMRNRLSGAEAANDQAPVMGEPGQVKAGRVKAFRMVNSLAAMVSDGELERLKANPAVAEVIPDVVIHRRPTAAAVAARKQKGPPTSLPLNVIPGACGSNGKVQLDPEGLQTTNTDSDDPRAKTARSLRITGAGVKVAYIADGSTRTT